MTLQLAVQITGNAASLKQAAEDAKRSTDALSASIDAAGGRAGASAAGVDRAAAAIDELAASEREAAGAAQGMGAAVGAAGDRAEAAAADIVRVTTASRDLAQAQRDVAAAATSAATATATAAASAQRAMGMAQQAQAAASGSRAAPSGPQEWPGLGGSRSRDLGAPGSTPAQAAASGLRSDQWKNLGFQANDIFTSLASGIPVTQVIAQQGGQVAQVLGDAPGGIAGGLKIIAQRAAGLVTPFAAVTASALSLGAAFVYAGARWDGIQDRIKRGLTGIGRQSGATADDIERSAVAAASGNLTRADARDAALAAASTGRIGPQNLASVAGLAPGFAQLTGSSISEAGTELARIFADPTKGAEEMAQRIGALSDKTVQYIKTLDAQGNRQAAISELARASQAEIARAAELTSGWARAWTAVKAAAGAAFDVVGRVIVGGTAEEELAKVQGRITALRQSRNGNVNTADPEHERYLRSIPGMTEEQIQRELYPSGPGSAPSAAQDTKNLDALLEKEKALTAEIEKRKAAAAEAQSNERSRQAGDAIRSTLPDLGHLQEIEASIARIQNALNDPAAKAQLGPSLADAQRAVDALRGARESYVSVEDKARASEALTIRSIEARTVAEKAAIAAERERLSLAGQNMSDNDRRQRIEAARQATFAQSTRESQDRLRDSTDANASAGLLSYPRQRAELETRYRRLFLENQGNLPAIANLQKSQALDSQAIDKEAIGGPLRDANRALNEQVAALKLQQDAFGASTEAAARMAETQRLVNQYAAAGVPISADMKRAIDAQAAAVGKVTAAQEELARKQREVIGGLDDIRSGSRYALTGIFSDVSQGRSPLDGLTSSLSGMASRVFDRTISTPLVNSAFGLDGKAGGGMFGDALSGIFGKQQGLSTADITAGIVNVNGTVSGIPGLSAANSNTAASAAAGLLGKSSSSADAAGIVSKLSGSRSEVADYVKQAAIARGIDPNVALRVVNQESGFNVNAQNLTSKEQSYGVMQLNTMGGLGADAMKAGVDVRNPDAWRSQVDYGLDVVKRDGWRQWYGARDIGVSRWEGVGQGGPAQSAASAASPAVTNLDASLQKVSTSATTATQGVTGLTSDLGTLPNALTQTSQGVTQLGNSLGSNGGGLSGILAGLFGGGGGGSSPAVTAATGGHVTGPGSGTSDSIPARLSNGEFVVKAAVTQRNLPFLHALNENRLPAFAEGGLVGMAVPPAARRDEVERQRDAAAAQQAGNGVELHVHDNVGVEKKTTTSRNDRGGQRMDVFLDQAVADVLNRPGSASGKALSSGWGMQRGLARRA